MLFQLPTLPGFHAQTPLLAETALANEHEWKWSFLTHGQGLRGSGHLERSQEEAWKGGTPTLPGKEGAGWRQAGAWTDAQTTSHGTWNLPQFCCSWIV